MSVAAVLALMAATPAGTQSGPAIPWGENPAQVAARRTGGEVVAGEPGDAVFDQAYGARAKGQLGGMQVEELFFFDTGNRLSVIKLQPLDAKDCSTFSASAQTEFGEPDERERKTLLPNYAVNRVIWRKREADRVLLLAEFPRIGSVKASCHVTIQPYGDGKPGVRDPQ